MDDRRDEEPVRSELDEGLEDLGRLARGLAGKVLGPRLREAEAPERPVLSPEADEAIERLGARLGHWLRAAGESMSEHPRDPEGAARQAADRARASEPTLDPDEEGWSPLVQGVRAFGRGLSVMAAELMEQPAEGEE